MGKILNILKTLRTIHWVTLLAVGFIGFVGTYAIGQRLEDKAKESWLRQAELDVAVATIAAQSWLAQSETIISGLALGFYNPDQITSEKFNNMVFQAEEWNSEFSLDAVAVVKRVLRSQRRQLEEELGHSLSQASDPGKTVPDAFDHMVVIESSDTDGLLRPFVDLLTMAEMGTVAKTAQRIPDKAIMGPAFSYKNKRFTLVGIGLPNKEKNTVIVGRVDLSEMIDVLMSNHVPQGISLRLSERDDDARANTLERPIFGPLEAGADVVHTETIRVTRGQARWNYNWDVTNEYMGGAPTANATMVQIGGLIITVLVVYSIALLSVQNAIIRRTVAERTRDLTEETADRKRAEIALQKSHDNLERRVEERTAELRNSEDRHRGFAADVAHELRTPLSVLKLHLDNLEDSDAAQILRQDVNSMSRLVEQLLTLARWDTLDIGVDDKADLHAVCTNVSAQLAPLALKQKCTIEIVGQDGPVEICGNPDALEQAIRNLVENAIHYSTRETTITIDVGEDARISVIDQGRGVPVEVRDDIFDRFQRSDINSAGLGLGLSIVRRIVEAHGGSIKVGDTPGGGATFTISFVEMA